MLANKLKHERTENADGNTRQFINAWERFSLTSVTRCSGSSHWTAAVMTVILLLSLSSIALGQSVEAFDPNANSPVYTVVLQADGKILIGGAFTSIGGFTGRFARLNADGTLDTNFNPNVNPNNFPIFALAAQADGKVLVGGQGGVLARLDPNTGLRDTSFTTSSGTNGTVSALVVQADGEILVGGSFGFIGQSSQPRNNIARLNPDGTVDAFNPDAGGQVNALAVQPDGKIVIGGFFASVGGQPRNFIARLNPDGSLDPTFNPDANYTVDTLALQADGKILVGGQFTSIGGQPRNYFARLNADGSLDTAFNPNSNGGVNTLTVQADGKALVGGGFTSIGGQPRTRLARLNADGTADSSFDINVNNGGAQSSVNAISLQADGKILVGGVFISIGGQPRNRIARLTNTAAALQTLSATTTTVSWSRVGTSPEIDRATFASSADGVSYTNLGNGSRVGATSDWQLTGQSLSPGNLYLRARGYQMASGTYGDGSVYESVQLVNIAPSNTAPTVASNYASATISERSAASNTGTFSDAEGNNTVTLTASVGTVMKNDANGTWSWSHTPDDGPANSQTVTITADDGVAPHVSTSFSLNVLNVAPTASFAASATTVNAGATGVTVNFTAPNDPSTADTTAGFRYSYDFDNNGVWDSGNGTYAGGVASATGNVPNSLLAVGPATVTIKGRILDKDGDFSNYIVALIITPETTPPDTSFTSLPPSVSGANVSFGFTGTDNYAVSGFECKLDSGMWMPCISPQSYSGLTDGAHTFQARAKDAAGNVDPMPATDAWQVFTASCSTIVNPATLAQPTRGTPFVQVLSASPTGSYSFSLLAGSLPPGLQIVNVLGIYSLRGTPTTTGTYTFTIKANKNNSTCAGARTYTMTVP